MFDSLEEQMEKEMPRSPKEKLMMYAIYLVAALVVLGGLYYGVKFMS
jgi:hypothetical protein